MPTKRSRGYNTAVGTTFVSSRAESRYIGVVSRQLIIPERGFEMEHFEDSLIEQQVNNRKWGRFVKQPEPGVISIIREFYSNLPDRTGDRVFVRGKQVPFGRTAINRLFGLEDIVNDEFSRFHDLGIDTDTILSSIAHPGTIWKTSKEGNISFKANAIDEQLVKAWYYFLAARMMPTTHLSDVTRDRAILLYCIVQGRSIDLGELLFHNILHCARSTGTGGLYFPSVITQLCSKAGVAWASSEEVVMPAHVINRHTIQSFKLPALAAPAPPAPAPAPAPSTSTSSRPLSMSQRLSELEQNFQAHRQDFATFRDYQVQFNTGLEQLMRTCALHAGVDVTQFPSMADYPSSSYSAPPPEQGPEPDNEEPAT